MTLVRTPSSTVTTVCRVCEGAPLPMLDVRDVPVVSTEWYTSADAARSAPRGDLDLVYCPQCGVVQNHAFDPALVEYVPQYENSQLFSPVFQRYARDLARRLIRGYGLEDARALEIGCGKGGFLSLLVEEGLGSGIGFDPSYEPDGESHAGAGQIEFVRDLYDERYRDVPADVVVCRHVLEHLDDPVGMLTSLRQTLDGSPATIYFEVPNAEYVFGPHGLWDLIYQHVTYFSAASLRYLFERTGFRVDALYPAFDGQFLSVEAHVAPRPTTVEPDRALVDRMTRRIETFGSVWEAAMARWAAAARSPGDGEIVLWGAGAKGVSFLCLTPVGRHVAVAVDVNPRKQGAFVPVTAQPIVGPDALLGRRVARLIISNPIYEDEIRGQVAELGLAPDIVVL